MRFFKVLILLLLVCINCAMAQDQLISAFNNLSKKSTVDNQLTYFKAFPSDFASFVDLFGYEEHDEVDYEIGPLYHNSLEYINLFFNLPDIEIDSFLKKVISISINGYWQADGVNIFQHNMRKVVDTNPDLTALILKDYLDPQIESFYFFYFNSIHMEYETIPDNLRTSDEKLNKLQTSAFNKAKSKDGH